MINNKVEITRRTLLGGAGATAMMHLSSRLPADEMVPREFLNPTGPAGRRVRARDLGIPIDGTPGTLNAITDVNGVEVGHTTLIEGDGKLVVGKGPVRTGVTAILSRGKKFGPVFAAFFSMN